MGSNGSGGGGGAGGAGRSGRGRSSTVRELTSDEKWALGHYTRGEFEYVNALLGGYLDKLPNKPMHRPETDVVLTHLSNALNALPDAPGTTYRSLTFFSDADTDAYMSSLRVGGTFASGGYLSTSRSANYGGGPKTTKIPGITEVNFTIKGKTGKNITPYSAYKSEEETLFDKGTRFKVTGITRTAVGHYSVTMEER